MRTFQLRWILYVTIVLLGMILGIYLATSTSEALAPPQAGAATSRVFLPLVIASSTPTPINTPAPPPTPISGQGIIADHSVIGRFEQIPQTAANAAFNKTALFLHQSTGRYIDDGGLNCLAGLRGWDGWPAECLLYANNRTNNIWPYYDRSKWAWDMFDPQADAMAKTDQFYSIMQARAGNYQVLGMKFCYVDGWNQSENVAYNNNHGYYITKMEALEAQYPGKIFIYTTSALWAEPGSACGGLFDSCEQIADFNQQVRAYALSHNKPLYDIAAIESHDQNGNSCTVAGYEGMCTQWYDSGGGHPNTNGAIRLSKGYWWLMARISGWNGN